MTTGYGDGLDTTGNIFFKNVHTGALANVDPLRWDNFIGRSEWIKITEQEYLDLINDSASEAVERDALDDTPIGYTQADYEVDHEVDALPVPKESWLEHALAITTSDRRRDYGHPLPNFLRICLKWSVTLQIPVTPLQVAQLMLDMKMARDQNAYKDDNWIDAIGYSNTVQMIDERMKELGWSDGVGMFQQYNPDMVGFMYNLLIAHEAKYQQGS